MKQVVTPDLRSAALPALVRPLTAARPVVSDRVDCVHPLEDARWSSFVLKHPRSSIFHTSGWLDALRRTYGYEPIAVTTTPKGAQLENAIVCCRVNSWLTGQRLVSLPFSDHCEPLVDDPAERNEMLFALMQEVQKQRLLYLEVRPVSGLSERGFESSLQHYLHQIDLTPTLDELFHKCHPSSTQRKIKRAVREKLEYEEGNSKSNLNTFYQLLLLTRRRQQLPPQPRKWFENLVDCLGASLKIRVALRGTRPIASIMTLRHRDTMVYKYGCSDAQYNNLGSMHFLLWSTIQEAKAQGLRLMDLGRSDITASGLVTFKDRWGSLRSSLPYFRFATSSKGQFARDDWKQGLARRVFSKVPSRFLTPVGSILYRHIG